MILSGHSCICGLPFRMKMFGQRFNKELIAEELERYFPNTLGPTGGFEIKDEIMEGLISSRFGYAIEIKGKRKCRRCGAKIIKLNSAKKKVEEFATDNSPLILQLQAIYRTIVIDMIQFDNSYTEGDYEFDYRHWRKMIDYKNSVYQYVRHNDMKAVPFTYGVPVVRTVRHPIEVFCAPELNGNNIYVCLPKPIDKDFMIDMFTYNLWHQIVNCPSRYVNMPMELTVLDSGLMYIRHMVCAMLEGEEA